MLNFEETQLTGFIIAGISIRTINKNGKSQKDIGDLFKRFFDDNIADLIPNKESDDLYCMYTDYENDFRNEYTVIVGCKISEIENLPDGLTVKYISGGKYKKYTSKGELYTCVGNTWSDIWLSSGIDRKYEADFDVYGKDAQDPQNAIVYTYLSIK